MIQIVTTPNEVNAALIKGFLENHGIQASYAPNVGKNGRVASCVVYCIENKKDEALELLKKEGLINS
jgi:CheY-like chemotaxis protein